MQALFLSMAVALTSSTVAQAEPSQIETIYQFLQTNVEKKKFRMRYEQVLSTGMRTEFQRTIVISGASRSDSELAFDLAFDVKQSLFEPTGDGQWSTEAINRDRIGFFRCVLNEQRATKEVIGTCRIAANTAGDTGSAEVIRLKLADGRLTTTLLSAGYNSTSLPDGGATATRGRMIWEHFLTADGKVGMTEHAFHWTIDPATFEPTSPENSTPSTTVYGE